MIGFVTALELEDVIDPTNLGSTAQRLHHAAQHPGRLFAAAALLFIASALLIPTVIHVLRLVRTRGRGTALAALAAGCLTIGALGHGALVGFYAVISAATTHQSPSVIAVLNHAGTTAIGGLLGLGIACFELGFLLLLGALVRSRIASRWLLLAIPAAIIGQGLGNAIGVSAFDFGQLAAVAPLVWLGWRYSTPASDQHTWPAQHPVLAADPALGA
jgi:hypothetical protein